MFHQKSRGVSLILFSDGVPEMESVKKPNYARYGHGASILDYTIALPPIVASKVQFGHKLPFLAQIELRIANYNHFRPN